MNWIKEFVYRLRGEYTTERLIKMGMKVGKNFGRLNGVILDPSHCWLIEIGDNVTMAPRVHVLCHDASTKQFLGYTKIGRVTIGNNVFVGADTVILPGVTIGNDVVIGANSTVTHNIPDNSVVAGSPAKKIYDLQGYLKKKKNICLMQSARRRVYFKKKCVNGKENDAKKRIRREKKGILCNKIWQ